MTFALTLSHVGIYVADMKKMLDFYTGFLGFAVSDRGEASAAHEIVFLTRDPREHHQLVLVGGRPRELAFNPINQISLRVDSLQTLRDLHRGLGAEPVSEVRTVTHGNALSVYFRDPEGNRIELLIDTPWYVSQPCRIAVDLSLPDTELWPAIEKHARTLPGFKSRAVWMAEIEKRIREAGASRRRTIAAV